MKRILLLTLAALAFAGLPVRAITPAGTVIQNQAAATVGGTVYLSNPVETLVLPVCGVSLLPNGTPASPGQTASVTVGGSAYLPYQIENTGNDTFTYNLAVYQDASSEWIPESAAIVLDANRNGQVDPGEREITSIELAAGESAGLILVVKAPDQGSGDLLVSPAASCAGGQAVDNQNYARVSLVSGPALQVEKSMAPAEALPGETVHVRLIVRNVGDEPTGATVALSDDLTPLQGALEYVPGSVLVPKGSVEYFDGSSWQATEPSTVESLRLVLAGLEVGEEAALDFDLLVLDGAEPQTVQNYARAEGPGGPAEAAAAMRIVARYEFYLGPFGNPRALPGGEGSVDDRQQATLIAGQPYCFEHTLENASSVADSFMLSAAGFPEGVGGVFLQDSGAPLAQPVRLEPGQSLNFSFCVTAAEPVETAFTIDLVARSTESGELNHTYDEVLEVLPGDLLVLSKTVTPEGTVVAGTVLTYTLSVKNDYPFAVTNLTVEDVLSEYVTYVSSTPTGAYDEARHRVVWDVETLSPGAVWQAQLQVRVKEDTPDDVEIANSFSLVADRLPAPVVSDPVRTPVWSSGLLLQKEVAPTEARLGDRLNYVLKVHNPSTASLTVTLTDTPDPHLAYILGSADPVEPEQDGGKLIWRNLTLEGGETLTVTYAMRVLAGAPQQIPNTATVQGALQNGVATASAAATAVVQLAEDVFQSRRATLVGRVFLDVARDGRYDPGTDLPLPGARLVLADGRQAVTDAEGRYAFRDLEAGLWLLMLDPATAPFVPLSHPEADAGGYRHRVQAWGLTVSDFPLQAPAGTIEAVRRTELVMGPLRLQKWLVPLGEDRFRVVLHLQSDVALPELVVHDPLPAGGEKTFALGEFIGEKTITYELEGESRLTDPEVRWRYP